VGDGRVRYVRNGDVRLAYRVYGDGETTLVWVPTVLSSIDRYDDPAFPWGAFVEQLSRDVRVVVYDGRGTGLSDPVSAAPSLDDRVQDLSCVLEAAGVTPASLFAPFSGGSQSLAFAARYPEKVQSLILFATAARFTQDPPDFPWGFSQAEVTAQLEEIENHWGEGALADLVFGAAADVYGVRDQWGRIQSSFAGPTMAGLLWQTCIHDDTRDILGSVPAPVLVLARRGDHMVPFEASQALASGLPNARFAELPPGEHHAFDIADVLVEKILKFCEIPTGARGERVLATVLFTDIVSSTEQLSASGDEHWRHQLDVHDGVVDTVLAKHGGRRVKHTGDGVFALFDGPTGAAAAARELIGFLATRGIRIRAGVHTGECERRGDEWSGMAVHIGARIGALAGAGEVLASRTVRDLSAGSGLVFESLGPQQLKGLPDEIDVYRVSMP
jgi:class 3 adenylate cyclase/pimeloyl-ACP methyl ester carboxylesterase